MFTVENGFNIPVNPEKFDNLYRELYPALVSFATRRARPDLAEDIAQEALVKAWVALSDPSSSPRNIRAWAWTATRNLCTDVYRNNNRLPTDSLDVLGVAAADQAGLTSPGPETQLISAESVAEIVQAVQSLKPLDAQVLGLEIQDVNQDDISSQLGLNPNNTKSILRRARRELGERLRESA